MPESTEPDITEVQAAADAARAEAELRTRLEGYKRRALLAESHLARRAEELQEAQLVAARLLDLDDYTVAPPAWVAEPAAAERGVGVPVLMLSDLHLDEVVNPAEVEGANAYDRTIADLRLKRVVDNTVAILREHLAGVEYEGLALFLGGDMFTGFIHEELARTNAATQMESLLYWLDRLVWVVDALAGEFGQVHLWGVVGNHGRESRKPVAKQRVTTNWDWLLYKLLAKHFAEDPRVTCTIPDSADVTAEIGGTSFLLTHGDQFRGGSGIAGIMSPLKLGHHRKSQRQMALGRDFEWMVMGHFHQYLLGQGLIVNGSMKGYDEYAYMNNFAPERPTQALWVVTREHGISYTAPVHCDNRKEEGW